MAFILEELILEAIWMVQPLIRKIRRYSPKLAKQIDEASESMGLNTYEANYASKGNRRKAFSVSRQEAGETLGGLKIARAKGILTRAEIHEPIVLLKRILACLRKFVE